MRDASEYLRREDVAKAYEGGKGLRADFVSVSGALTDPSQAFFLYNVAHANTAIRSPDGKAWMRALGFFESKAKTQAHANEILRRDPGLELRYFPAAQFFCVGRSKYADVFEHVVETGADGLPVKLPSGELKTRLERTFFDVKTRDAEVAKAARLVKRHAKTRREQLREVKANALWKRMGDAEESLAQQLAADDEQGQGGGGGAGGKAGDEDGAARRTLDDEEAAALLRAGLEPLLPPAPAPAPAPAPFVAPAPSVDADADADAAAGAGADADEAPLLEPVAPAAPAPAAPPAAPAAPAAPASAPAPAPSASAFGAVKPIPRKLERRLQRFVVLALIDDYLTLDKHERAVNAWCARRDAAYAQERELLLWRVLEAHGRLRADAADGTTPLTFAQSHALDRAVPQDADACAAAFAAAQDAALASGQSAHDAKAVGDWASSNAGGRPSSATTAAVARARLSLADVLPPLHKLVRKWLIKNPPPTGFNVWGEYIGKEAAASMNGLGFIKLRRSEVLAKLAAFLPPQQADKQASEQASEQAKEEEGGGDKEGEDRTLTPPASAAREIKIWEHQRDMRVEEHTWRWAGHYEMPARRDVLGAWYAKPENARPDLNALPQEEPAVAAFRAFDSEADAQRWVKSVEKVLELKDYDLAAVAMYEWIRLEDRNSDALQRNYRNEHVHDIMASKAEQAARARELELEARLTKRKLNVVTVTDNAVAATQELPAGLSAADFDAATAAAARADAETAAELAAEARAAEEGKTYVSKKLSRHMLAGETREISGGAHVPEEGAKAEEAESAEAEGAEVEGKGTGGKGKGKGGKGKGGKGKGDGARAHAHTSRGPLDVDDLMTRYDLGTFKSAA
jgi:hypothetical protein